MRKHVTSIVLVLRTYRDKMKAQGASDVKEKTVPKSKHDEEMEFLKRVESVEKIVFKTEEQQPEEEREGLTSKKIMDGIYKIVQLPVQKLHRRRSSRNQEEYQSSDWYNEV